jgi:glucosamine-6-phosphate deaminase
MSRTRLDISTVATAEEVGALAAGRILDRLAAHEPSAPFLLGCPAGRTPTTTYSQLGRLAAERHADLSGFVIVMIDEFAIPWEGGFVLCEPTAHFSCRRYVRDVLLPSVNAHLPRPKQVSAGNVRCPDPADPQAFDAMLDAAGGVDIFLLASGASDGHVGFNPPGTPLESTTRVVTLAQSTRRDNLDTFPDFQSIDEVPHAGVTVGLQAVTGAREVVMLLLGAGKRMAVQRLLDCDGFEPSWPASVVYECRNAVLIVDDEARPPAQPPDER